MKSNLSKLFLLLAVVATMLSTACKKDPTKTELLTQGTWRLVGATIKSGTSTTDVYATLSECDKDNIATFVTGGVYKEDEGAKKCNASDPQTITGAWVFTDSETKMTVTVSGTANILTIVTLDANTFKATQTETFGGTTVIAESTFAH